MTARAHTFGRLRRATQLASALLWLALPFANAHGHRAALGSLASARAGPIDLLEPAAALSALLAAGREAPLASLLLAAAPLVLLAFALGPVFCSWICPFGFLSEGLDRLRRRPTWAPDTHVRARAPRALLLAAVLAGSALLALPLGALLQGPRAITVAALEAVYLGAISPFAVATLGALLLADLVLPRRLFCRALCPAGAAANYLRTPATLHVARAPAPCACTGEPHCQAVCPWGVDPRRAGRFDGCTSCLACVDACPTGGLVPAWRGRPRPPHRGHTAPIGAVAASLPPSPAPAPVPSTDRSHT